MTYSEAVTCFGDTIPIRYLDRSGVYHDETATLVTNNSPFSIGQTSYIDDSSYLVNTRQVVLYSFQTEYSTPANTTPQQVTVRLQPEYSIFDTTFIYTAIGISIFSDTNLQAYNSPVWSWVFAGQTVQFDGVNTASNNVLPNFYLKNTNGYFLATAGGNIKFNFVPAYMVSQAITSGYSTEATFDNVWGDSTGGRQTIYIAIGVPYVSVGASGATGTPTTTAATTTQNINVNVDVDLNETNGLLGSIISAITGSVSVLVNGIRDLFIPTHEQLESFLSDLEDILYEKIAPLADAVTQLDRVFSAISYQGEETSIRITPVSFNIGEDVCTIDLNVNENGVPLIPRMPNDSTTNGLLWACKHVINIVCTLAFINMCKHKVNLIINPDAETFVEVD